MSSFVKAKAEFTMTLRNTRAHSFDDLAAFYECENTHVAHASVRHVCANAPQPGTFNLRHSNFARFVRPLFAVVEPVRHARIVALFHGLALHRETNLSLAVTRLLASDAAEHSPAWCAFAGKIRPNRRAVFLTLLAETGLGQTQFQASYADFFLEIDYLATRYDYAAWMFIACKGLLAKVSMNYLISGFRIAHEFNGNFSFSALQDCADFDATALQRCFAHICKSPDFYPGLPCSVWRWCAELPGLNQLIGQVNWSRLRPKDAQKLLHLMYGMVHENLAQDKIDAKWRVFKQQFPATLKSVYAIPSAYRRKAIDLWEDFYWYLDDPQILKHRHGEFSAIVRQMCRPPFSKENSIGTILCALLASTASQRVQIRQATGLRNLEKFCRSQNTAWLVKKGIPALRRIFPEYAAALLTDGNPRLLEIARLLGCLGRKQRYDALSGAKSCAVMSLEAAPENLGGTLSVIDAHLTPEIQNPVPKKLRAFARGEIPLSTKALTVQINRLASKLAHFRLHFLAYRIRDSVRQHYGAARRELDHALLLTNLISENRKALRKFLSAYISGDGDYVQAHPATRLWFQKAPAFDQRVWRAGMELCIHDEAVGEIRIAIEHDPLEKLKLGTYVGSCLGLGGSFMFSAAAVVLDANKHVVYARDRTGRVVARQLVCMSDEGKLVPFSVYPVGTTAAMQAHFAAFDRAFAAALGVDCYEADRGEDYTIKNILSQDWWDDGVWDLNAAADSPL